MRSADSGKRRLLEFYSRLDEESRATLLTFADFLAHRDQEGVVEEEISREPLDIPRPEQESVVAAIRRLTETYPMLERKELLNETSSLMSAHVLQGRVVQDVVNDLERVFRGHYERFLSSHDS